jgi:hypothetical protein
MSRLSTGLSRDEHVHATERKAFSVEVFAFRNGISRSQAFKEISTGRLIARKVGSRTIITEQAEKAWQRTLPKAVPPATPKAQRKQSPQKQSKATGATA